MSDNRSLRLHTALSSTAYAYLDRLAAGDAARALGALTAFQREYTDQYALLAETLSAEGRQTLPQALPLSGRVDASTRSALEFTLTAARQYLETINAHRMPSDEQAIAAWFRQYIAPIQPPALPLRVLEAVMAADPSAASQATSAAIFSLVEDIPYTPMPSIPGGDDGNVKGGEVIGVPGTRPPGVPTWLVWVSVGGAAVLAGVLGYEIWEKRGGRRARGRRRRRRFTL